jgi:carotenoid cleavage dioxygenase-like enzyme
MQVTARRSEGHLLGYQALEEELQIDRLTVEGEVPAWLAGSLLRTGPAKWDLGQQRVAHWFDGLAMLHRFSFAGGDVGYGNRFLRGRSFRAAEETGRVGYLEFATDPCRSLFRRLATLFVAPEITDNGAVNITRLGEQYMAMTESPMPVVFDPGTLESLGVQAPRPGTLPTAHPHREPASGDLIGYTTKMGARSKYQLFTQAPGRKPRILASIPAFEPAYLHSFAITERYAIILAGPFVVRPLELALSGRPLIENFRWKPDRATKIYVLDRHSGDRVATLDTDPVFCFHHINAFEHGQEIVMDLIGYDDPSVIDDLYLDAIQSGSNVGRPPIPRRLKIGLAGTPSVSMEQLADIPFEMPRINYTSHNTKPYRYTYGAGRLRGEDAQDSTASSLVKLDVHTGESRLWADQDAYPGEPVFVADPARSGEDAGVLLSVVLDAASETSYLLVLDAQTLQERARALVPHHIPFGIHGEFYADEQD